MTPVEQHASHGKHHAAVPFLDDMLSFWEAVDAATEYDQATEGPAKGAIVPLYDLRQNVGTAELRDLVVTLHSSLQQCYLDWKALYGEFDAAFDWEWIPAWVAAADWSSLNVGYNHVPGQYFMTMLQVPTAQEVNAKLDNPFELLVAADEPEEEDNVPDFSIPQRVFRLISSDDDDQTERMVEQYQDADEAGKKLLDDAFISLCGYSFATLIKKEEPGS